MREMTIGYCKLGNFAPQNLLTQTRTYHAKLPSIRRGNTPKGRL